MPLSLPPLAAFPGTCPAVRPRLVAAVCAEPDEAAALACLERQVEEQVRAVQPPLKPKGQIDAPPLRPPDVCISSRPPPRPSSSIDY